MKRRFLLTIAVVLVAATATVGFLQYFLFSAEQFRLIDKQIESTASLLISSPLTAVELKEFEDAERVIENTVGGEKLNQFIIVINRKGKLVFQSKNAQLVPPGISREEKWQTLENDGHFIRVLTLPLEKQPIANNAHRILQVGIILDADLLRWHDLGRHVFLYSILILGLVLFATWILSKSLLRPLQTLAEYLKFMGNQFNEKQLAQGDSGFAMPPVPVGIAAANDEFGQLMNAAQSLNVQIRKGLRTTQVWTAQMAHEMKTPLTILQNSLDAAASTANSDEKAKCISESLGEIRHLNTLITGFLEWTSAENFAAGTEDLHAIRLKGAVEEVAARLLRSFPGRIELQADSNLTVFARPGFVNQAISNLVVNALKYSEGIVRIDLSEERLTVEDEGSGISPSIIDNLGQPFNYDKNKNHGFGLGLAWVTTICKKYRWQLHLSNRPTGGARVTIIFPSERDLEE